MAKSKFRVDFHRMDGIAPTDSELTIHYFNTFWKELAQKKHPRRCLNVSISPDSSNLCNNRHRDSEIAKINQNCFESEYLKKDSSDD